MAYDYFPEEGSRFAPSYGMNKKLEADVVVNSFGDGYEQRIPKGINYLQTSLSLSWNNIDWDYKDTEDSIKDGNIIYNFLKKRLKLIPFYFRETIMSPYKLYICESLGCTPNQFSLVNITAEFKEYRGH